jgi:hypothetical protein
MTRPAKPKAKLPEPSAATRKLEVFVGKWHAEGESYAEGQTAVEPRASAVSWKSDESYEWLPGGFFLLHTWDAVVGERVFKGTEIIGYDEAQGGYFTRFFDNTGNHPEYRATVDGLIWSFKEASTRAKVTVSQAGDEMKFVWEWQHGNGKWLPLCDRVARRLG